MTEEVVSTQQEASEPSPVKSAFTIRSIGFGVLGLLFTIYYAAINDIVFEQTSFISNHLPPGPIFLVISVALLWNPMWSKRLVLGIISSVLFLFWGAYWSQVWGHSFFMSWHCLFLVGLVISFKASWYDRMSQALQLSGRELMVTLLIILAGCWTAAYSMNYHFSPTLMNMWKVYSNNTQMQNVETIEYIPSHLWPAGGLTELGENNAEKKRIYDSYFTGSEMQGESGVPWDAWIGPIMGWAPLFILVAMCLIAMSFVVHRQWSKHEQLAYPIAKIGSSLFEREEGRALPSIFYSNLFRIAVAMVILFHGIRMLHVWWPSSYPDIPTKTYFNFMLELFPILPKSGMFSVHAFNFYFCIVGISYFLSREVGLTVGLGPILLAAFGAQYYMVSGSQLGNSDVGGIRVGAYLVYAIIIIYTGRHYYYPLFKKAFFFKPKNAVDEDAVFAARLFVVAFLSLILVLRFSFDLDLDLAFLFSLLTVLMFLVFTRIICETGMPYIQSAWEPSAVMIKMLGVSSIGAAPIVLMYYISAVLLADPKESVMPYVSNGLKIGEDNKINLKKIFMVFIVVAVVAVFVSMGTRLYQQYTLGGHAMHYSWADNNVPTGVLKNATRNLVELRDIGELAPPESNARVGIIDRITNIDPDSSLIKFMLVGGLGVLAFAVMRFRYTWFPLHPVLFLIIGITPIARTFYSFLIGWLIREAIVKFGGGKVYQNMKPLFIGLIFGELFMMAFSMFASLVCYLFTGEPGPSLYFNLG